MAVHIHTPFLSPFATPEERKLWSKCNKAGIQYLQVYLEVNSNIISILIPKNHRRLKEAEKAYSPTPPREGFLYFAICAINGGI